MTPRDSLIILFGLPGAGKNFAGHILAEDFGFAFHDADDDLPDDMRTAILNKQMAAPDMRDRHLANILASIARLRTQHHRIAVAGAFFKEQHRLELLAVHPAAIFALLETPRDLLRGRLARRQNHLADLRYAEKIFAAFEPPQHPHVILRNDAGREELREQIQSLVYSH